MWIRIHCNFSNPQGLIIEIKKERIKLQLSSDRNKGRFQFFREDLFIKGSGIILTLCIWWNFFARSFSLVKRELHVFMKLFFSLSSFFFFFARNRSREKNFSNSYYKNERILRSTVRERYSFFLRNGATIIRVIIQN